MAAIKKNSPYRHAYTDEPTQPKQKFCDLPKPYESSEARVLTASAKWVAMAKNGAGGPVVVRPLEGGLGRMPAMAPVVNTHRGKVTDLAFTNFNPDVLLTASEDTTIHATQLQAGEDGALAKSYGHDDALFSLEGHDKKVSFIQANPTSDNILASSSWDKTVKVWDMATQKCILTNQSHSHTTFCLEWNRNGSLLGTTCKDHMLRVFDPRSPASEVRSVEAFDSSKCSKVFWVPQFNWVGAFGFTKQSKRTCKIWDLNNMAEPILSNAMDSSSSVCFPLVDAETNLLWLWSKGDGSMSFNEILNGSRPTVKPLGVHRSSTPTKGGCFIPKIALKTEKCEVARFLKLTANPNEIVPLSFVVPRKSAGFASDLFPDCPGAEAAQKAEQWIEGNDADPIMTSMDPKTLAAAVGKVVEVKKTYAELVAANKMLEARVAELEAALEATN